MSLWQTIRRRLRICETNYGRAAGWFVEWNGRCVAILQDYRWADMFWDQYTVEWVTTNQDELAALKSNEKSMWRGDQLQFRNREFDEIAANVLTAGGAPFENDVVIMRGLYLPPPPMWPWEWLLLWGRKLIRKSRGDKDSSK